MTSNLEWLFESQCALESELTRLLEEEQEIQRSCINLVAPSNIVPREVMRLLGSCFTNVVAEGYRGNRYHTGTGTYDRLEEIGILLARRAFKAGYVNLKPHSGTQAVQATLVALKGEGRRRVLSLGLQDGGHISHGGMTAFNQLLGFDVTHFAVTDLLEHDYDDIRRLAKANRAEILIGGGSACPKAIDWNIMSSIARECGARLVADISHFAGLILAGVYPNPCLCADVIVSSTSKSLPGPKGGMILCRPDADEGLCRALNQAVNIGLQSEDIANGVAAKVQALALSLSPQMPIYGQKCVSNARALGRQLHRRGVRVLGYDERSQGTDSHLLLIDVTAWDRRLSGYATAEALARVGVLTNKNLIPKDQLKSSLTSGVRFGTASVSGLGMGSVEMEVIGDIVVRVLEALAAMEPDSTFGPPLAARVRELRSRFRESVFDIV